MERFVVAWRTGDVDGLMSLMSPSATFRGSVGEGPGSVFHGSSEIRAAFTRMAGPRTTDVAEGSDPTELGTVDPLRPEGVQYHFGDRCLTFWSVAGADDSNSPIRTEGVDVFSFDDQNHIVCKDAYRKAFPPDFQEREHGHD